MLQVLKSTNFDPESPLKVAHMVDLGMPNVNPSVGSIHMMPTKATHKHCVVDEVEDSSTSNKGLKNATVKNPRVGLTFKAKLDFVDKIRTKGTKSQTESIDVLNLTTQNNLEGSCGMFLELEESRVEGSDDEKEPYSLEHGQNSVKEDDLQIAKVSKSISANRKLKAQLPSNCSKKKNLKKMSVLLSKYASTKLKLLCMFKLSKTR